MKVFIVLHGEKYESGGVCSVHKKEEDAIRAALAIKPCFAGGWIKDDEQLWWENGCDFVSVEKWDVV